MGQLNDMVARSAQTTKDKGFRQDWEDAEFLEMLARSSFGQNASYSLSGDDDDRVNVGDELRRIATQHRSLMFGTKLALAMSECAEALEEVRDHGIDAVIRGETKFGEELADVHIRLFDMEDICGLDTEREVAAKQEKNDGRPHMHGRKF